MLRMPKIIYNNKFNLPSLPPPGSFKDQNVLITGGNSGLGLATAVQFINLGVSTVIITTRDATKGEAAKASIEAKTHTTGKVKVMELNMSTFASVKAFADTVKQEVNSIDYVLLNAGLLNISGRVSPDGFEETIQARPIFRFTPSLFLSSILLHQLPKYLMSLGAYKIRSTYQLLPKILIKEPLLTPTSCRSTSSPQPSSHSSSCPGLNPLVEEKHI